MSDIESNHKIENTKIAVFELTSTAVKIIYITGNDTQFLKGQFTYRQYMRRSEKTDTYLMLDKDNLLNKDMFQKKVIKAIHKFRKRAEQDGIEKFYAVGTAAYRLAENKHEIRELIRKELKTFFVILSPEEEAQAILDAYKISTSSYGISVSEGNYLLVDSGGASTEIIVSKDLTIVWFKSLEIGSLVLKKYFFEDVETEGIYESLKNSDKRVKEYIDMCCEGKLPYVMREAILSGNTIKSLKTYPVFSYYSEDNYDEHKSSSREDDFKIHGRLSDYEQLLNQIIDLDSILTKKYVNKKALQLDIKTNSNLDSMLMMRLSLAIYSEIMKKFRTDSIKVNQAGLYFSVLWDKLGLK